MFGNCARSCPGLSTSKLNYMEAGNGKCRLRLQVKGGGGESKKRRCRRSRETAAP